jgi:hypothetical protein
MLAAVIRVLRAVADLGETERADTILDGKTGAKREVIVAAPPEPTSADTTGQLPRKR